MKTIEDRYLGDGVYASFDGYHVWLDLRAQDSTTRIGLEPAVLVELDAYRAAVMETFAEEEEKGKLCTCPEPREPHAHRPGCPSDPREKP